MADTVKKAPRARANKPTETLIGTLDSKSGVVCIGDASVYNEGWITRTTASSKWAVDYSGAHADYLASRAGSYALDRVTLADGTVRVLVPHAQAAAIVHEQAKSLVQRERWDDKVITHPVSMSMHRAIDACREKGVGVVNAGAFSFGATQLGERVQLVELRDKDGQLLELRIRPA